MTEDAIYNYLVQPHNLTRPSPRIIWAATQKKYEAFHLDDNYIHAL